MTSLTFVGEFQDLSSKQIQFIRDVLEKRGYKGNKVLFAPVGKTGDNYAANVKRITVEIDNGDNFSIIAKVAPIADNVREMMTSDILFNNEIMMYSEILPKFVSLQKAANVPKEDILRFAECYGYISEKPHELILIEDLTPFNFSMLDRVQPLPHEAVVFVLKNFAILHSLSYVLNKMEPETYNTLKSKLIDMWYLVYDRPENEKMSTQLETDILSQLNDDNYKNKIRGALTGSLVLNKRTIKRDKDSKHSVIIQGDGWTNNILFQKEGEVIKECIMIDYQVSREANPVCDILYMLYICTDHKTRTKHFNQWLDYYHMELDKSLNHFGIKANNVYPKDLFDADMRRYSKIYFATAIMILNILLRKSNEAAEMKSALSEDFEKINDTMAISTLSSETASLYIERIKGLIDTCQEFGLL